MYVHENLSVTSISIHTLAHNQTNLYHSKIKSVVFKKKKNLKDTLLIIKIIKIFHLVNL